MDHSLESHKASVNCLCRICGRSNNTIKEKKYFKKPCLCSSLSFDIMLIFGLNIKEDEEGKHSKYICQRCMASIRAIKKSQSVGSLKNVKHLYENSKHIWCSFNADKKTFECSVCALRANLMRGCIPKVSLLQGWSDTSNNIMTESPDTYNTMTNDKEDNQMLHMTIDNTSSDSLVTSTTTFIKRVPDDSELNVNKTGQDVSNQQIPLKYEVKDEMMCCRLCPYSDIDFGRLKFHTFSQHPTGAAVVKFGESDHGIKFFCVKETCNFSTTVFTVYEEHLRDCPLRQTLSGNERKRLKSTLQFIFDFHNKHRLSDVTGFLQYFSSLDKTFQSEDEHVQLEKHKERNNSFSVESSSSSYSDIQSSSMVCADVGGRELECQFSSVQDPVPVFIVQNQNTDCIESETNLSDNISMIVRKQKNNEWLLKTGPSDMNISKSQDHKHLNAQTGKKPFSCVVCYKSLQYQSDFLKHMRIHTGERPFKCDVCDKGFADSSNLIIHRRTHTGEKPFTCDMCEKKYARLGDLTVHKRIHTGEKPFKCDVCDKGFPYSSSLKTHLRTHTDRKPFKCDVCGKEVTSLSALNIHKRTHTGEKPFKCNVCDKGFAGSGNLIRHKRTHTGEKPFKCNVCNKGFGYSSNLKNHKKTHTG